MYDGSLINRAVLVSPDVLYVAVKYLLQVMIH